MPTESALADTQGFLDAGYLAANPPTLQRLCLAAYRLLARGEPVHRAELADATCSDDQEVEALMTLIPASAYERRVDGAFSAFMGLSLAPTTHVFVVSGRVLYTWCAFDALFLPALLGSKAVLTTTCPATRREIRLSICPERAEAISPQSLVMSLAAPDRTACCADLRGAFCAHVNFYVDREAYLAKSSGHDAGGCVSLDEAFALARRRNAFRFADIGLGDAY